MLSFVSILVLHLRNVGTQVKLWRSGKSQKTRKREWNAGLLDIK